MANRFTQNFTLTDIFSNKALRKKLPYISYKEKEEDNGEVKQRTQILTVRKQVFDNAISSAKPFYSPMSVTRAENMLILDGNMIGDHDQAVDAVYNSIKGIRAELIWTANTANMLRSAMKEAEQNRRKYGIDTRLYLRAQSMQEIEGMSRPQLQALLNDVVDNIYYGDNFPKTQKKYGIDTLSLFRTKNNYEYNKEIWKQKVGA